MFGIYKHGDRKVFRFTFGGKPYEQPKKFCVQDGWRDLASVGGEEAWDKKHANCAAEVKPQVVEKAA